MPLELWVSDACLNCLLLREICLSSWIAVGSMLTTCHSHSVTDIFGAWPCPVVACERHVSNWMEGIVILTYCFADELWRLPSWHLHTAVSRVFPSYDLSSNYLAPNVSSYNKWQTPSSRLSFVFLKNIVALLIIYFRGEGVPVLIR